MKQEAIAVTAVAFANQKGGRIFIGVENDGQIIGAISQMLKTPSRTS
jgi:predicted HTH transcriptional regulator